MSKQNNQAIPFEQFPVEIILMIISHLKIKDIVMLGLTNNFFYRLVTTTPLSNIVICSSLTEIRKNQTEQNASHEYFLYYRSNKNKFFKQNGTYNQLIQAFKNNHQVNKIDQEINTLQQQRAEIEPSPGQIGTSKLCLKSCAIGTTILLLAIGGVIAETYGLESQCTTVYKEVIGRMHNESSFVTYTADIPTLDCPDSITVARTAAPVVTMIIGLVGACGSGMLYWLRGNKKLAEDEELAEVKREQIIVSSNLFFIPAKNEETIQDLSSSKRKSI